MDGVSVEIATALESARAGARVRDGFRIAVVGAPNVGKSTLINALARKQVAITSEIAGTTRDVLEVACDFGGLPVVLFDTAGLRETSDPIERIGVERAQSVIAEADLRLLLTTADLSVEASFQRAGDIVVWTKSDLHRGYGDVVVSCSDGSGLDGLVDLIVERLSDTDAPSLMFADERQRRRLDAARNAFHQAMGEASIEFVVDGLKRGIRELDELIGPVTSEAVLDDVFARFCMGK